MVEYTTGPVKHYPDTVPTFGEYLRFDYSSHEYFTSITESFLKTLIGIKIQIPFLFLGIFVLNLKNVVQIPIEDYVIYSLIWQ